MGPMFLGLQVGSTAGHLAERALGSSAFPLPWPDANHALIVVRNLEQFAEDWSLDHDAVAAFTIARELAPACGVLAALWSPPASRPCSTTRPQPRWPRSARCSSGSPRPTAWRTSRGCSGTPRPSSRGSRGSSDLSGGPRPRRAQRGGDRPRRLLRRGGQGRRGQGRSATRRSSPRPGTATAPATARAPRRPRALFGVDLSKERVDLGAAFVAGRLERDGFEALARL